MVRIKVGISVDRTGLILKWMFGQGLREDTYGYMMILTFRAKA